MSISLVSDLAYRFLPSGECVVYSPQGSARPFVLEGKALDVFHQILKGELAEPDCYEVRAILDHFSHEKMISGHTLTAADTSTTPQPKRGRRTFSFWIHTTDNCNLRCDYCYVKKGRLKLSRQVVDELLGRIIRDRDLLGVEEIHFKFAGGEPLMAMSNILYLLNQVKIRLIPLGLTISASVVTNGTLITEDVAKILKQNNFSVMVSLDGVGAYNDARHYVNGRSSYDDVVRGIDCLLAVGIKPAILTVLSNTNIYGLDELVDFVLSRGLKLSLSLSRDYSPENGPAIDVDLFISVLIPKLHQLSLRSSDLIPNIFFNGFKFEGRKPRICGAGSSYLAVGPTGTLSSCQMTIDTPLCASVFKNDLPSVGAKYVPMGIPPECNRCVWRYVCCGGCQVVAENAGTIGKPSVLCPLMKEIIPLALAIEGRKIERKKHLVLEKGGRT